MQQYGDNGRPYDQNRDSLRSSGSSQRTTPPNDGASDTSRYGFNLSLIHISEPTRPY